MIFSQILQLFRLHFYAYFPEFVAISPNLWRFMVRLIRKNFGRKI